MRLLIDTDDTLRYFTFTLNYRFIKLYMGEHGVAPEKLVPLIDCEIPESHIEHLKTDGQEIIPNLRVSRDAGFTLLNVFDSEEYALAFRGNFEKDGSYTRKVNDPMNSLFRVATSGLDIPVGESINLSFYPNKDKILELLSDYKNYDELITASPFMVQCGIESPNIHTIYMFKKSWSTDEVYAAYNSFGNEAVTKINNTKVIWVDDFFHLAQMRQALLNK